MLFVFEFGTSAIETGPDLIYPVRSDRPTCRASYLQDRPLPPSRIRKAHTMVVNTWLFDRTEIVDFGGLGGPGRPGNLPKRRGFEHGFFPAPPQFPLSGGGFESAGMYQKGRKPRPAGF